MENQQVQEDVQVQLQLTVPEVNVILRSLGKHPFEEIALLIQKIKAQGDAQLQEITAAQPAPAVEQAK